MTIIGQLDTLAELQAQRDVLALNKQAMIDSVLTPEIKTQIADIEIEFLPQFTEVDEKIAALTAEVKGGVLAEGKSVKGAHLHAVYAGGRVSYDTKALDKYAKEHPEIDMLRSEGQPSVSIRKV